MHDEQSVLIVDDTPENIQLLSEVLSEFKRKAAVNGKIALKLAQQEPQPDIILLDIMMPEMDGYEVCERLKADPKTKDIPVIFITAKNSIEDETKGLSLGAVDFISKPISPPSVLARVKNHLELQKARKIMNEQNIQLEERNRYITDSIKYAKRIQSSILPTDEVIASLFKESFIIFKPKDIVSGDFYWAAEKYGKKIIACVDCTGHGVPGAFMSMIGNTLLNDIVNKFGVDDAGEILNMLDKNIIEELNKNVNTGTLDGMDLGLIVYDNVKNTVSYSGAGRPLFYFTNGELTEVKGTRKSIGDIKKDKVFTTEIINIENETMFYFLSDGYIDQNNFEGKKFGTRQFREVITEIHKYDLSKQKEILISRLDEFKGDEPQRDDVTVIGIRI